MGIVEGGTGKEFGDDMVGRFLFQTIGRLQPGAIFEVKQNAIFGKRFVIRGKNKGSSKII